MIQEFLNRLEDPGRPLLGPIVWVVHKVGLFLPKNIKIKILYLICHEFVSLFVVTQYIELYLVRSDLDLMITNLRVSIVSFICVVKVNTFIYWETSWKDIFDYITETDKNERQTADTTEKEIVDSYTRYCRQLLKFYWVLMTVTLICVAGSPLIRCVTSSTYRAAVKNGTEPFPHVFSSWVPFDKFSYPGSWLTVCFHTVCCAYGATMLAVYDSMILVIMVFFEGCLKLLRHKCTKMFDSNGSGATEEQVEETVRDLCNAHVKLLKYSKLFDSLLSPIMFLYVVMCSIMLCACIIQLTLATSATQKLLILQYFIFAAAPIFMFCWHSSKMLDRSEQLFMGPYESEWWTMGVKQRKEVLILTEQLKLFPVLNAGPFSKLTLSTFVNIIKGAYSYYTILRN